MNDNDNRRVGNTVTARSFVSGRYYSFLCCLLFLCLGSVSDGDLRNLITFVRSLSVTRWQFLPVKRRAVVLPIRHFVLIEFR